MSRYADAIYCILRLIVGLLFASHGAQLVLGMFGGMPGAGSPMIAIGGSIQLIGGILIALGLLTRIAAFVCSGEMAVAYFVFHAPHGSFPIVNEGELSVFYCWVFLFFVFYGPGLWSLDALLFRRSPAIATTT